MLRSTRQQYHQRIAQVLEARFPESCETQPELLAHHYTEAGVLAQAIPYWQRAGQRAIERSAHVEAISHLTKGLEVLTTLPDTPARAQHELTLHTALGVAVLATKGYAAPEVERVYARAREICRQVGDTPQLLPVLWGLWAFYEVRGELQTGLELAEQFSTLAQRCEDPALLLEACYVLGDTFFWLGAFGRARVHAEQGIALYEPQHHHALAFLYGGGDPGIACRNFAALALWFLGYPEQALTTMHEALALARELSHPVDLAFTLDFAASLHTLRREGPAAQERAEAAMAVSREHDFAFWLAFATILRGWAWAEQGDVEAGRAELSRGLAAYEAIGATLERPYWLALLAEAAMQGGRYEEGLTALAGALAGVRKMGMGFFYEAELYRLQGELLLKQAVPDAQEAETCFRQALSVAGQQQAKSLELRAAVSLSRLWQQQGKRAEARALLAPIYGWFTEGFDTADLREAQALLAALA